MDLPACLKHPEFLALLHQIRTAPDQTFPRLACADWLEMRGMGEPARRWRMSLVTPFSRVPLPAEFTLQGNPTDTTTWRVVDGFLHGEGTCNSDWNHVAIWRPSPRVVVASAEDTLSTVSNYGLIGLDLSRQVERRALPMLVDSHHTKLLNYLWLDGNGLIDEQVRVLRNAKGLASLRALRLGSNRLTAASIAHLMDAPWSRDLTALELDENDRIGPQGAQLLGRTYVFPNIKILHLAGCKIADDGALGLAESRSQWMLEELDLRNNGIGAVGLRALLRGGMFDSLTRLELAGNPLTSSAVRELVERYANGSLTRLGLADCWIGMPAIQALAMSENTSSLTDLDVGHNGIREGRKWGLKEEHIALLASSPSLARLTRLSLAGIPWIGNVPGVFSSRPLFQLKHLDLSASRIGLAQLPNLLESPWLKGVQSLVLDDNPIGDRGAALLANHPGAGQLQELSLARCGLGDDGLLALTNNSSMADLRHVDLRGQEFHPDILREAVKPLGLAGADYLARSF